MTHNELTGIRERHGLSKSDFAKRIGITAMLLGRYESGKLTIPDAVVEKVTAEFAPAAAKKKADEVPAEAPKNSVKEEKKAEPAAAAAEAAPAPEAPAKAKAPKTKKATSAKAAKTDKAEKAEKTEETKEAPKAEAKPAKKRASKKSSSLKAAVVLRSPVESDYSSVIIEAQLGGQISIGDIVNKLVDALGGIPEGLKIYVKPEENKAYYSSANGNGYVDLW